MADSDSDLELKKIPMKPGKQTPTSSSQGILVPEKKLTTKAMIHDALTQLKTRKGVSVQAMKKYMEDKYNIETEKVKYLIKKTLKSGVEDGSIIQLKGIGASGSFKLAAVKEKPKKPKPKKEKPKKEKSTKEKKDKPLKDKPVKVKPLKDKPVKDKSQRIPKEKKNEKSKAEKKVKMDVKSKEAKMEKPTSKVKGKESGKSMTATPKKKGLMMKRKSIGSIIKPPKMKPKVKA